MAAQQQASDAFSIEHLHADLKGRSIRGGLLTLTSQGAQFIMQSIATVVLARLLTPADFGLVAMVTALTGLAQGFADLGLSEATIQHPEINHHQVSTLFWLKDITFLGSLTFLIGGLRVQHDALLRRQMRFKSLAIRDVASYVLAVPVAITLAWRGAGYWAIVALPLTLNLAQMALSWIMARWIPGLPRRDAKVRSLIAFGGNIAASYLIFNVNRSADSILIGWHWGAGPLGLYSRAYNLLMLPVRQLGAPARSVAVPTFSRVQGDPERLARYYLRTANLIMWITAPIFGFLFVAAVPVIILTLGNRWRAAAPVFEILSIFALGQLLLESTLWLFVSRGQSQRLLKLLLIISPVIIGSYAIGLPFGIKGVALSGSLVLLVIFPWILTFSFNGTNLTLKRFGQAILYPIAVCVAGICSAKLALQLIAPPPPVSQLLVAALGFAVGYALSVLIPRVRQEVIALKTLFGRSHSVTLGELAESSN